MRLASPEEAIKKVKKAFKPEHRFAFLSAFSIGLLGHLYVFVNFLLNTDGPNFIYFNNNVAEQGRWLLMYASTISSDVTLPWVIGLLSLLYLSLTAMVLVELLELKNKLPIFLVSAVLVLYPSITETFSYLYTADPYLLALLFSALSVLCVKKWKWGIFPGAFLLLCSMGIYQAYISFAALLILLVVLLSVFDESSTLKGTLISLGRYLAMGVIASAANMVMMRVFLKISGKTFINVTGANMLGESVGSIIKHSLGNIGLSYPLFFHYTFNLVGFATPFRRLIIFAYVAFIFAILIYAIIKTKLWQKAWRLIYVVLFVLLFPVAANIPSFISGTDIHYLVIQPYCIMFMLAPIAIDRIPPKKAPGLIAHWGTFLLTILFCFQFFLTANIAYTSLHLRMERSYSMTLRLVDRIEQTEGYYPGMPLLIVGTFDEEYYPDKSTLDHLLTDMGYTNGGHILNTPNRIFNIMLYYHGMEFEIDQYEEFFDKPEVKALEVFPNQNSIAVVDGVMVVRLSNEY